MDHKITLYYFNFRGRGELIRLLLHAAGVEFMDQRVEFTDWPNLKRSKSDCGFGSPEGTLPFLEIDGQLFGESLPLARFIARKYNLMGKTELEQLTVDIILNYVDDIRMTYFRSKIDKLLTQEQKEQVEESLRTEVVPRYLSKLDRRLQHSQSGFIVGEGLTLADIAILDILDTQLIEVPTLLVEYPRLIQHRTKVQSLPKIARYLAKRLDSNI